MYYQDKKHGKGVHNFPTGDVYEGEFVAGVKQGKGKITFKNGDVFEGTFLNDLKSGGKGTYKFANGNVYDGTHGHLSTAFLSRLTGRTTTRRVAQRQAPRPGHSRLRLGQHLPGRLCGGYEGRIRDV